MTPFTGTDVPGSYRRWQNLIYMPFICHPNSRVLIINSILRQITLLLACLICICGASTHGQEKPTKDQISEWRKAAENGNASAQYSLGRAYDSGDGVPRDFAEAAKWYRKAADQGNAEAQCELAFIYQCGNGLTEDAVEAAKWYRKAAELGNITAQIRLGIRYMGGSGVYAAGVTQDEIEGLKWWKMAADQGSADAAILLGEHFLKCDYNEGLKWLRIAAEHNNPEAMIFLGDFYANGKGLFEDPADAVMAIRDAAKKSMPVPASANQEKSSVDFVEAARWYRKAAEQKDGKALRMLGLCSYYGVGLAKDLEKAVNWYREAANENNYAGQLLLGYCYATGSGVALDRTEALKCWQEATWPENKILNRFIETWSKEPVEMDSKDESFLGDFFADKTTVLHDLIEAKKWYRKAAEKGFPEAQRKLGSFYFFVGNDLPRDATEAARWYRKAAEQGEMLAQYYLATCYLDGDGAPKNPTESVKWYHRAAEQGYKSAQSMLAICYSNGDGVAKDAVLAYKWGLIAAAQGKETEKRFLATLEEKLTREQIAEGQKLARNFKPRKAPEPGAGITGEHGFDSNPRLTGTGFFITRDGFIITNNHLVKESNQIRIATSGGLLSAKIVKIDSVNDLALLKTEGKFPVLPVMTSRGVKLGGSVATVGFPNIGLQGFAPKLAKGEIASLTGAADDIRYFQISVPVQPGNSGGALVDERGNVVGVVSAKLSAAATLAATGSLPENVNYAVKSSFLLGFLESVPEVASALQEPNTKEEKFETVVKTAEQATVLILVY